MKDFNELSLLHLTTSQVQVEGEFRLLNIVIETLQVPLSKVNNLKQEIASSVLEKGEQKGEREQKINQLTHGLSCSLHNVLPWQSFIS